MPKPENMAETSTVPGAAQEPAAPPLTPAQVAALDGDLNGEAGGSLPKAEVEAPKAGKVVKKGKPAPAPEDLGNRPEALVLARITEKGDKRVHDGQGGRYDHGDEVVLQLGVAQSLRGNPADKKALGYVEILGKV